MARTRTNAVERTSVDGLAEHERMRSSQKGGGRSDQSARNFEFVRSRIRRAVLMLIYLKVETRLLSRDIILCHRIILFY